MQFWRKKKSMAGMSLRSLSVNCFFQTIILLYLFDNDTSWMILFSSTLGLGIEYWKLAKAFNVRVVLPGASFALPAAPTAADGEMAIKDSDASLVTTSETAQEPLASAGVALQQAKTNDWIIPVLTWGTADSYRDSSTQEHDDTASQHLIYALMPLVVGYSAYSLLHAEHKSFYSWFLRSLVGELIDSKHNPAPYSLSLSLSLSLSVASLFRAFAECIMTGPELRTWRRITRQHAKYAS